MVKVDKVLKLVNFSKLFVFLHDTLLDKSKFLVWDNFQHIVPYQDLKNK